MDFSLKITVADSKLRNSLTQGHCRPITNIRFHVRAPMTVIILTTIIAAFINGGIGYGFSSITVPVALIFLSNRVLNPALVLVEVGANLYVLLLNRKSLKLVWKRLIMILIGLVPAVLLGSFFLKS